MIYEYEYGYEEEQNAIKIAEELRRAGIDTPEKARQAIEPSYFAIIPTAVLEDKRISSSAKILYAEILTLARMSGKCYATNQYLGERLGCAARAVINQLAELKKFGFVEIDVKRSVKGTYRDIYVKMDFGFMNGGHTLNKMRGIPVVAYQKRVLQREDKKENLKYSEPSSQVKEDSSPYKEKALEIKENVDTGAKDIAQIIDSFKEVNPAYRKLFGNTTQRGAVSRLISQFGAEKILDIVARLKETNTMQYAPVITTPLQLEDKFGQLAAFVLKQQDKKNRSKVTII